MIKFILKPFDVLFFGSGKPFNFSVQEASSIFPSFPNTLASSICSKILVEKGIDISRIIKKFYGPFLEKNNKILFPKPLDILREKKKENGEIIVGKLLKKFRLINPSYIDSQNNLKALLWIGKHNKNFEIFKGFITLHGLKKWLNNSEVSREDLVDENEIFEFESRIGIKMDYFRNVTKEEDAIYRINFVRLKNDTKIVFFVEFDYNEDKIFEFFDKNPIKVLKLGGEMRSVSYEVSKTDINQEFNFRKPEINENDIIKILYLTPGSLDKADSSLEILTGAVLTINLAKLSKHTKERKIKRGLVPGSVIYAKVKDKNKVENFWLNPQDDDFIGTNLKIYTKVKGVDEYV
ncbi:MAG: type III-B CRISPR module-associated protein Cmr3 [candidate division WOR-3 bacterium]|jgi:CRISPR-associated protein Cmr3